MTLMIVIWVFIGVFSGLCALRSPSDKYIIWALICAFCLSAAIALMYIKAHQSPPPRP